MAVLLHGDYGTATPSIKEDGLNIRHLDLLLGSWESF
jgi:hypothetical protein